MSQKLGTAAAEDFCVDLVAMAGKEADFLGLKRIFSKGHSENPGEPKEYLVQGTPGCDRRGKG